ncbi:oxidoreductase [Rhodoferax sediminis]|uniref:SDR family NAD(P)-dependent oxidoreductase n=1 Tax=Rhodoferax sediminis TaxID=2509614 RepID=A0A515DDX2_9BURK|nr:oxidoreductase [Rhodoferax sediminis]QDL38614.1 SDR family NAD(P)-dependent oxidoreductase [Rhodoferax sediminis]
MKKTSTKTWLITGADKGLGYFTAKAALERGDRVAVTVLATDGSHSLAAQYPDRLLSIHLDARDHARCAEVVAQVERAFGGVDILVNNAGYGLIALAEETGADKYRPLFEVNFFGLAEMTRAVLPIMRRQRSGHIVNLSSVAGFAGSVGFGFYCAAKHAVEGYSETLAMELKHLGIHVTIVEPGGHRSDFAGASLVTGLTGSEDYAAAKQRVAEYQERRHGKQPSDPAKFGLALCRLVDAEQPPLRLPIGEDAVKLVREQTASVAAELERWTELSLSTRVDE